MHLALVLIATLCLSTAVASHEEKYPAIIWSDNMMSDSTETTKKIHMNEIIEVI